MENPTHRLWLLLLSIIFGSMSCNSYASGCSIRTASGKVVVVPCSSSRVAVSRVKPVISANCAKTRSPSFCAQIEALTLDRSRVVSK